MCQFRVVDIPDTIHLRPLGYTAYKNGIGMLRIRFKDLRQVVAIILHVYKYFLIYFIFIRFHQRKYGKGNSPTENWLMLHIQCTDIENSDKTPFLVFGFSPHKFFFGDCDLIRLLRLAQLTGIPTGLLFLKEI